MRAGPQRHHNWAGSRKAVVGQSYVGLFLYFSVKMLREAETPTTAGDVKTSLAGVPKGKESLRPMRLSLLILRHSSAGWSNGFLIQREFLRLFSLRCTPVQVLGLSVDRHSHGVTHNCAVLDAKKSNAVEMTVKVGSLRVRGIVDGS
jgi:hypothetical protein